MSKKHGHYRNEENIETTVEEVTEEQIEVMDESMVDVIEEPVYGYVNGCSMLNIRNQPNGDIVTIVKSGAKLMIDMSKSPENWFSVYTEDGIKGFCMKSYVNVSK